MLKNGDIIEYNRGDVSLKGKVIKINFDGLAIKLTPAFRGYGYRDIILGEDNVYFVPKEEFTKCRVIFGGNSIKVKNKEDFQKQIEAMGYEIESLKKEVDKQKGLVEYYKEQYEFTKSIHVATIGHVINSMSKGDK